MYSTKITRTQWRLQTERLNLRPVKAEDLFRMHQLFTQPLVCKYLCDDEIFPPSQIAAFICNSQHTFEKENFGLWLLSTKRDAQVAGVAGFYRFFEEDQPQLLYALHPAYWKQGFATEVCRQLLEYAFQELGYYYMDASCDVPNTDSIRVMERLGMHRHKEEIIDGKPLVFYRIWEHCTFYTD
jgi:[ribosomal protein S5]-alanine N-acetyltransferase